MKKIIGVLSILIFVVSALFSLNVYAEDPGYVTQTDIVCFIDYSPIESYNYKNKTYVVAEDLMNYGFDVVWNNERRELTIDRKEYSFTPYIYLIL